MSKPTPFPSSKSLTQGPRSHSNPESYLLLYVVFQIVVILSEGHLTVEIVCGQDPSDSRTTFMDLVLPLVISNNFQGPTTLTPEYYWGFEVFFVPSGRVVGVDTSTPQRETDTGVCDLKITEVCDNL